MMEFGSVDRHNEPDTDEFEKLEFVSEEPAATTPELDDTSEIVFTPEQQSAPEPPVSFNAEDDPELSTGNGIDDLTNTPELDFGGNMPFELFGTSLFDDPDMDDDLGALDPDPLDDDLEF